MAWLFKSFQSDGTDSSPERSPSTTPRGVKDDLSLLGQTLGRQFRGVADFLAPPPPPPTTTAVDSSDPSSSSQSQPQPLLGIRNDLAEIGGSFRTGLSLLSGNKAVSEISRLASNLLQFESDEVRDDDASAEEDDGDRIYEGLPGVNDEVLDFVSEISTLPELWTDFPLPLDNDFNMSDAQKEHASTVERLAPSLAILRVKLQSEMSEEQFWLVYFILLLPRLSEHDVELLSTSKIIEARNVLLQKLQKNAQVENEDTKTLDTSQDGSEAGKPEGKNIPSEEKEVSTDKISAGGVEMDDEESTEKWSEEKDNDTGTQKKVEPEEEISFSDLEDDDNALSNRPSVPETKVSSPSGSSDWVQLKRSSDTQRGSDQHKAGRSNSGDKDSEGEESNDWLTVDDYD